jgi:glycosyltransferase involved in cell wall biosynthesis
VKILHVVSWYPSDDRDFAGVFIRDHVRCLGPHVEQQVVVPTPEGDGEIRRDDGFSLVHPRLRYHRGAWLVPYVRSVASVACAFKPQIVHGHVTRPAGVACRWVARQLGIPYLLTEHTNPFSALFETHLLNRGATRWALRGAGVVTAVSRSQAADIEMLVPGVHPIVVPNTVDVSRFAPRRQSVQAPARLLFIGRLVPLKACDVLLEALRFPALDVMQWTLTVVGSGPEEPGLHRRAAGLRGRVTFLGYQPPAHVPEILSDADILILPSIKESFGVVAIEALAAGVPVVATRCGGPEDIITDDVGRLVAAGSAEALAEGIRWMLENYQTFQPQKLRTYAAERFGFEAVARRFVELYRVALYRDRDAA